MKNAVRMAAYDVGDRQEGKERNATGKKNNNNRKGVYKNRNPVSWWDEECRQMAENRRRS